MDTKRAETYDPLLDVCVSIPLISLLGELKFMHAMLGSGTPLPEQFLLIKAGGWARGEKSLPMTPASSESKIQPRPLLGSGGRGAKLIEAGPIFILGLTALRKASSGGTWLRPVLSGPIMFHPRSMPLNGEDFHRRFDNISESARRNFDRLRQINNQIRPIAYADELTDEQDKMYTFVAEPADWESVVELFRRDVRLVPVLFLAVSYGDPSRPDYITIATFRGRVLTLSMPSLWLTVGSWFKEEEILPADFRSWLEDPEIYVVVSGLTSYLEHPPPGLTARALVDTEKVFARYQDLGVIRPNLPPKIGDVTYQMTYAFDWHHRPCSVEKFHLMVRCPNYSHWPAYRSPGWRPAATCGAIPKHEVFHHYCEVIGPLGFIYRLLRHGLVYGGLRAVEPDLPFCELITVFLRGNLAAEALPAASTDPLGLQTDRPIDARVAAVPQVHDETFPDEYVVWEFFVSIDYRLINCSFLFFCRRPLVIDEGQHGPDPSDEEVELHDEIVEAELRREAMTESPPPPETREQAAASDRATTPPARLRSPQPVPPPTPPRGRAEAAVAASPPGPPPAASPPRLQFYREEPAEVQVYEVTDSPDRVQRAKTGKVTALKIGDRTVGLCRSAPSPPLRISAPTSGFGKRQVRILEEGGQERATQTPEIKIESVGVQTDPVPHEGVLGRVAPGAQPSPLRTQYCTGDIRTRYTLINTARAFAEGCRPPGSSKLPVYQDINTTLKATMIGKKDKDPFLAKVQGRLRKRGLPDPDAKVEEVGPPPLPQLRPPRADRERAQ